MQFHEQFVPSDSVTVGNRVFKISGFYSVTLTRPNTCDSTVDLTLTVELCECIYKSSPKPTSGPLTVFGEGGPT